MDQIHSSRAERRAVVQGAIRLTPPISDAQLPRVGISAAKRDHFFGALKQGEGAKAAIIACVVA